MYMHRGETQGETEKRLRNGGWIGTGKTGFRVGPGRLERRIRAQIDEQHELDSLLLPPLKVDDALCYC